MRALDQSLGPFDRRPREAPNALAPARRIVRQPQLAIVAILLALVVILSSQPNTTLAADDNAAPAASPAEIRALIEDLGSPKFATRDLATRRLQELGDTPYEALLAATGHESREVRMRATSILRDRQYRTLLRDFEELGKLPSQRIDVEYGMWLIARILNPRVQRETLQKPLDELARRVRVRLGPNVDLRTVPPKQVIETLRLVLFEEEKFAGNQRDYTNPENSSLEFVLAKRRGLPILMSHVLIAVAQRLDWPLVGVPLPGRYIVRYDGARAPAGAPKDDLFFDAFAGESLTKDDLARQFGRLDDAALTERSSNRQILIRMMNNLESHLAQRGRGDQVDLTVACRLALHRADDDEESP